MPISNQSPWSFSQRKWRITGSGSGLIKCLCGVVNPGSRPYTGFLTFGSNVVPCVDDNLKISAQGVNTLCIVLINWFIHTRCLKKQQYFLWDYLNGLAQNRKCINPIIFNFYSPDTWNCVSNNSMITMKNTVAFLRYAV